jgi:triacylglycerol lipase
VTTLAPLTPQRIQDPGERELVLYSQVGGPIRDMSFLQRALLMCEAALIAYNDADEADRAAKAIGFQQARMLDNHGAQAMLLTSAHDQVLACRGTEPKDWNDVRANANAVMATVGSLGRVHSGFNREVADLWPALKPLLRGTQLPMWICGHSLGGAMATIAAYRCRTSSLALQPQELHTFGSPRVGCGRYTAGSGITHYRWVHNNDIVTRVPPVLMGYRHGGHEIYIDRHGRISKLTARARVQDRAKGMADGARRGKLDWLADHSVRQYGACILAALEDERAAEATGQPARPLEDMVIWAKGLVSTTDQSAPSARADAAVASPRTR